MVDIIEDPKKRKRVDEMSKELIDQNSKLAEYIHKLEFALLETSKKYYKSKVIFKNYISQLADVLDRAGYTVPTLPVKQISESDDNLDLDLILKDLETSKKIQEEIDSKKKKTGRPKKDKPENP